MHGLSSPSSSTSSSPPHSCVSHTPSLSRCNASLIVQFAAVFMHVEHPTDLPRLDRIAAYYLMAVTFYTVIWSARISILFSIIRIDPDPVMRHRLKWLAAAFLAAVGGLFFQLFWTCEHIHGWKNKASPQCPLPKGVAIFQLISAFVSFFLGASTYLRGSLSAADILADLSLILLPLRLIRGIKDKRLRWRLIFIFSTSSEYFVFLSHKT